MAEAVKSFSTSVLSEVKRKILNVEFLGMQ